MARRFAYVLLWLALTAEIEGFVFGGHWATYLTTIDTFLFRGLPIVHLVPWDILLMIVLTSLRRDERKNRLPALSQSLRLTAYSLLALWFWGVVRHGSSYQTIWQLHSFVIGLLVSRLVVATCRTTGHIRALLNVVMFASVYRACVLLAFYFNVARHMPYELPAMTDHADTVLFVLGVFIPMVNLLGQPSILRILWALVAWALFFTAIALNGRRIAWLGVAIGLVMVYALLPEGGRKRRIRYALFALSPAIVAYVAAGWGHPVGIFKPVGSISTMFGANQDVSSMMRDIENYNLVRTLKTNPLLGLGWGHEYIEEVRAYDISGGFPQYRYLPHNSLLGVLAFTGMFGFAGTYQIIPVAAFCHARAYRVTAQRSVRVPALVCLLALMIIVLEMWGDVGFNHPMINVVMGIAIGIGGRLAAITGALSPPQQAASGDPAAPVAPRPGVTTAG